MNSHFSAVLIILFMLIAFQASCHGSGSDSLRLIWDDRMPPAPDVKAPEGFSVTPCEAFEIVRDTPWALSLKHVWHLYADSTHYYVHDSFLWSNAWLAKRYGVIVDGRTGAVLNR